MLVSRLALLAFIFSCPVDLVVGFVKMNEALSRAASSASRTLQTWYNNDTGLWDSTGWWNSANALTTLADFAAFEPSLNITMRELFNNTFIQAPLNNPTVVKVRTPYFTNSYTTWQSAQRQLCTPLKASTGFTNNFYDDEGWWALAWLKIFDLTHDRRYLQSAIELFEDMTGGYNATWLVAFQPSIIDI